MGESAAPVIWIASGMGAVILVGGGAWVNWISREIIQLGKDMVSVKRKLKINGKG